MQSIARPTPTTTNISNIQEGSSFPYLEGFGRRLLDQTGLAP